MHAKSRRCATGNHVDAEELHAPPPEEPMPDFSTLDGGPEHHKVAVPATAVGECSPSPATVNALSCVPNDTSADR